jgi:CMP-N,N'-diacetyllegionaminic acid synthase
MAIRGRKILGVVPARAGSKGIPGKNLRPVGGISLVGRAAALLASLPWADARIISTDGDDIAREAVRHGIEAPFMRPDEHSGDMATSVGMWRHAWLASEAHYGCQFDLSILLEPTSPLRLAEDVERTVALLLDCGAAGAMTVSRTPAHYTPHKTLTLSPEGRVGFYLADGGSYATRQKIPDYYHRNGICYALTRQCLVEQGEIIGADTRALVIEREIVNIDDPFDLEFAEWLMARQDRLAAGQRS